MARGLTLIRSPVEASHGDLVAVVQAKLGLTEMLLASDDPAECVQRALEWLAEHTGIARAFCAVSLDDAQGLAGLGAVGVDAEAVLRFRVDLDERQHPLVRALGAGRATSYHASSSVLPETPFGAGSFFAVPLPLEIAESDRGRRAGLLLGGPSSAQSSDVRWLADVLGHKLVRLRERHRLGASERRLARERALLHQVMNAVSDPILLTDPEGRMILANARAESLFASADGETEGRSRAVALNNMMFSAALSQRAISTEVARREVPLVDTRDGSDLLYELIATQINDAREGTALVSILRNVTDLRRASLEIEENYHRLREAEAEVRAERDRLDLVINSVADPIVVTDPAGNLVLMNTPAERLFTPHGPDGENAPSEEVTRAVRTNDAHFSSFVSTLLLGDDERRRGELNLVDPPTGSPLPFEAISGQVVSEHGDVTAIVTILHDRREALEKARLYDQLKSSSAELEDKVRQATSELVRQNELLRRQHIELEQASALKSQFLANMSHEFRTPLNAILGYTSMLLKGVSGELGPAPQKNLQRVDSNARHLLGIINAILDISRIEAGRMPLQITAIDVDELLREVLAEVEPLIEQSRLTVTASTARGLAGLRSDRQKVKQIVLNLLTNAIKFTPEGSVTVRATLDRRSERMSIAVVDSGIGIAPADRERVFEDFQQVDSSPTREYGGTGLGLAICRRLAKMLDGQILLESQPGKGSTFTLQLPLRAKKGKS